MNFKKSSLTFFFISFSYSLENRLNSMTFILHLDNSISSRCSEFVASYVGIEKRLFKYNSNDELDCKLPACILKDQSLVVSGLCHVSRQAIKFSCCQAGSESERKKLEALLVCNFCFSFLLLIICISFLPLLI